MRCRGQGPGHGGCEWSECGWGDNAARERVIREARDRVARECERGELGRGGGFDGRPPGERRWVTMRGGPLLAALLVALSTAVVLLPARRERPNAARPRTGAVRPAAVRPAETCHPRCSHGAGG